MFRRVLGPGIEVRLMQEADAWDLFPAVQRNRAHLRPWLAWVDHTQSVEDVREFIAGAVERYHAGQELHAAIWIDGEVAGGIGHHTINVPNRSTSIGYWLAEGHQGKGVITRCCHVLLDYLFDERALHRVELRCGTHNGRSCAVAQRLGFTFEGVLRQAEWVSGSWIDLKVWSILEQEWRK